MPLSQHLIKHLDGGIFHCAGSASAPGRPCTLTRILCVCVRACVFVYLCVHTCVGGGGTHMCMGRSVWGGGVHAHVYGCARCMRVSVGWGGGARTCVHVCAQYSMCVCVR